MTVKRIIAGLSAIGLVFATALALAAGQYGPGVSDSEIKIGNTMPYSGPASPMKSWQNRSRLLPYGQ